MSGVFNEQCTPTVGAMFHQKEIEYHGVATTIEVWDTAGEERFASLASFYYKYIYYLQTQMLSSLCTTSAAKCHLKEP